MGRPSRASSFRQTPRHKTDFASCRLRFTICSFPYSREQVLEHFLHADAVGEGPERHLGRWEQRIAQAPTKDASFLYRDETLWTAGALIAVQRSPNAARVWRKLCERLFGSKPPLEEGVSWSELLSGDNRLLLEVSLPSPLSYRTWLADNLVDRHALVTQKKSAASRKLALEGATHLDALLINSSTGFALHFEAKVLSDVDAKTTHDPLRNQLARNIDCLLDEPGTNKVLTARRPDRSFMALLTPELFRTNQHSRLYGHLYDEYKTTPGALALDLPHRAPELCASASRRLGWLTFEDVRAELPGSCPWLADPTAVALPSA